jgi:hypothetical protein
VPGPAAASFVLCFAFAWLAGKYRVFERTDAFIALFVGTVVSIMLIFGAINFN